MLTNYLIKIIELPINFALMQHGIKRELIPPPPQPKILPIKNNYKKYNRVYKQKKV